MFFNTSTLLLLMGSISGTHEPSLVDKRSGVPILLMSRTGGAPPSQRVGGSEGRDGC